MESVLQYVTRVKIPFAREESPAAPAVSRRSAADFRVSDRNVSERNPACLNVSAGAGALSFLLIPWPAAEEIDRSESTISVQVRNLFSFTGRGLRRRQSPRRSRASIGGRAHRA